MKQKSASLTVEAALVLPIFIYAVVAFLYFIQIIILQESIQSSITEVGKYVAKYAYVYNYVSEYESDSDTDQTSRKNEIGTNEINTNEISTNEISKIEINNNGNSINKVNENNNSENNNEVSNKSKPTIVDTLIAKSIDNFFIKQKMKDFLNEDSINNSCIANGFAGLSLYESSFMEDENKIDIIVVYKIKLPFSFFNLKKIPMVQRVRLRGWTGYNPIHPDNEEKNNGQTDEQIVYITETGTVYHINKECTHLKLSIRKVLYSDIKNLRNESGGKYKDCELCGNKNLSDNDTIYITDTGDRYHTALECSGLKRSIIPISILEVGDRTACKRCSNKIAGIKKGGD